MLDTNVLLAAGESALRCDEARVLEADREWIVSDIVLWEIAKLRRRGRIRIGVDDPDLQAMLGVVQIVPVTLEIARPSQLLDFEADPADEIIAAMSLVHRGPLVTRDSRMLESRLVPLAIQ